MIVATEAMAASPNTAMAHPASSVAVIGLAIIGLAIVSAMPMAVRRARA